MKITAKQLKSLISECIQEINIEAGPPEKDFLWQLTNVYSDVGRALNSIPAEERATFSTELASVRDALTKIQAKKAEIIASPSPEQTKFVPRAKRDYRPLTSESKKLTISELKNLIAECVQEELDPTKKGQIQKALRFAKDEATRLTQAATEENKPFIEELEVIIQALSSILTKITNPEKSSYHDPTTGTVMSPR